MCDRMRDTRQGHIKEEIEGACVCCRQTSLERFIDRCVSERSCGDSGRTMMTHKCKGSIVVLSISKSVEPNEEQKEMTNGFQQGIVCKY